MPTPPSGPDPNFGSGKLVTPCERMQRDMASACAFALAVWAADGCPPFGKYERQACMADRKAGPFTSTPFTFVLFGDSWIWMWMRPPFGSGKLLFPWERMHREKASACAALAA